MRIRRPPQPTSALSSHLLHSLTSACAPLPKVWIAEQKAKQAAKKQREIDREFAREQTIRDTKAFVLTGTVSEQERQRLEVGFMYDAPPGTEKKPGW